jgi:hypothetical protein
MTTMKTNSPPRSERLLPPGIPAGTELKWLWLGLLAAFLVSLSFIPAWGSNRDALYRVVGTDRILITDRIMPDFANILGGSLYGFLVYALCMPALALFHWSYFRRGSMSVYVMKRLPVRGEYLRRCAAVPLIFVLICAACAFLTLCLYYWIYMKFTPQICLAPDQWQKIWRVM